jgi:hypothetical protein
VTRLTDQKDFFAATKNSEKVIALFSRESNRYGKIMEEHMKSLSARHMEARFIYVDAENAPFITDKLNIYMLPTIVCIVGNKARPASARRAARLVPGVAAAHSPLAVPRAGAHAAQRAQRD